MSFICPFRNPIVDSSQNNPPRLQPCQSKPYKCSEDKRKCTDGVRAFQMQQFNEDGSKFVPDTVPFKPVFKEDEFKVVRIWSKEDKSSSSDTVIAEAVHVPTGHPVIMKVYYRLDDHYLRYDRRTFGLLYEQCAYSHIKQISDSIPHFVNWVGNYTAYLGDLPEQYTEIKNQLNVNRVLSGLPPIDHDDPGGRFVFTVTSYVPNAPNLSKFIQQDISRDYEELLKQLKLNKKPSVQFNDTLWRSIVFQLLFAVYAMYQSGVQHNDLHLGNILVDSNSECKIGVYVIDGHVYEVALPVKILIFDFDFASTNLCGRNMFLDMDVPCSLQYKCNDRHPKVDVYTVLYGLWLHTYDWSFENPVKNLLKTFEFFEHSIGLTNPKTSREGLARGFLDHFDPLAARGKNEPTWIKTPAEIIEFQRTRLFQPFYKGPINKKDIIRAKK